MRKSLLFCFTFFFFTFNLFSQAPYYKMLGDTNRWYVSGYFLGVKPSGTQNTTNVGSACVGYYKATRDSVYNSKSYKIFEQDQIIVCGWSSASPISKALIREDTIAKKNIHGAS